MKRGTPRHPKTKALARALKIPVPHAAGLLACLWDYVSDFYPDGGIGRLADEEIADACGWPEKRASELIVAMTDQRSRWLDPNTSTRLYVHDWAEHCEDTVHRKLARSGQYFANGEKPKLTRLTDQERARAEKLYAQSAPNVRTECAPPLPLPLPIPKPLPKQNGNPHPPDDPGKKPSQRFGECLRKYPRKAGIDAACQDWISCVTVETEDKAFACLDRYLASEDVARGCVMNLGTTARDVGWIVKCFQDGWESDWPKARDKEPAGSRNPPKGLLI
jgi:hypothetical protein